MSLLYTGTTSQVKCAQSSLDLNFVEWLLISKKLILLLVNIRKNYIFRLTPLGKYQQLLTETPLLLEVTPHSLHIWLPQDQLLARHCIQKILRTKLIHIFCGTNVSLAPPHKNSSGTKLDQKHSAKSKPVKQIKIVTHMKSGKSFS